MKSKRTPSNPRKPRADLQDFIDYSIMQYEDLGRVISRALKSSSATKPKK